MTKSRGIREHHGFGKSPVYAVWNAMRARCGNPSHEAFQNYGARGITVCDRWSKFSNFIEDMGEPAPGMTLERKDNDKGYSPENCKWATRREQGANKRTNILVTIGVETLTLSAWVERLGLKYATVHQRIRYGWPPIDALTIPLVTQRKGVPRGKRVYQAGAENGVVWSDPKNAEQPQKENAA